MRTRTITAKHPGKCRDCNGDILPGNRIYWSRGNGATHYDCAAAKYQNEDGCTSCKGEGTVGNGAPCRMCDGTGSRKVQDFARAGGRPSSCWKCRQIIKGRPYRQHGVAFCNTDCASSTKGGE